MKILYHANCNDGSGAALAVWMHLGNKTSTGEEVEYIPVQYGSKPPEIEEEDFVYILDFSYDRETMKKIISGASYVVWIDHHKGALEKLSGLDKEYDNIEIHFDLEMSGAALTWRYFHPLRKQEINRIPDLFRYIQDRDLWQFEMEDTNAVAKGLKLYPDWRDWKPFLDDITPLLEKGRAIQDFIDVQSEIITSTEPRLWGVTCDTVPIYNLPGFMLSDTLHKALQRYPECDYAVGYFDLPDRRVYSLRSRKGSDVDVCEIVIRFGGGGHKHAAGFSEFLKDNGIEE